MSIESTTALPMTDQLDGFVGRLGHVMGDQWAPASRKCIARAPGRLDLMGGFAEYTGSLVLSAPLEAGVLAAASVRDDQRVSIWPIQAEGNGAERNSAWPLAVFHQSPGLLAEPQAVAREFADQPEGVRHAAAALYGLLHSGCLPDLGGGVNLAICSELQGTRGAGAVAAATVAGALATVSLWAKAGDPLRIAQATTTGQNLLWGRASDIADAVSVCLGQAGQLLQLRCRTREVVGALSPPEGVSLTGIESGACSAKADPKYREARTTAFMGRNIISRILAAEPISGQPWDGSLSQLTLNDYVDRLRDRLPTKIRGSDFIERFGQAGDSLTRIDPDKTYKVRSRTEHHIYENARSWQFVERLARASRTHNHQALIEAGELMYASHWSYGQRCGLGSIQTDKLVNLIRSKGTQHGIFGAKISARGAGGTVVVLHADTQSTRNALSDAVEEYARQTGCQPKTLTGTSPGAVHWGIRNVA
ncbi:MAG: galactokinase family protein [Phycisphaerae bacterium]